MNEYTYLVLTRTIEAELEARAAKHRRIRTARQAAADEPVRAGTTTEVIAAENSDAVATERIGAGACYC